MSNHTLAGEIRALSEITPRRGVAALCVEVVLIAACVGLAVAFPTLTPLAALLIATRQSALTDLLHAGVHHHLCPDVRLNDLLSEAIAWPMGFSAAAYRRDHCHDHDLDAPPPLALSAMMRPEAGHLSLLYRMSLLSFYAAVLIGVVSLGLVGEVLSLWLLPRLMMPLLPANTGTLDLARLQVYTAQYRTSHLRFPSVPWYHLGRLDARLEN